MIVAENISRSHKERVQKVLEKNGGRLVEDGLIVDCLQGIRQTIGIFGIIVERKNLLSNRIISIP